MKKKLSTTEEAFSMAAGTELKKIASKNSPM